MCELCDYSKRLALEQPSDYEAIKAAIHYAFAKHALQLRRSGEAYFCHPYRVALTLRRLDFSLDFVIAGLLHDTREDTLTKLAEISQLFGAMVALLVDFMTKTETSFFCDYREKAETFLAEQPLAIFLRLADQADNLETPHLFRNLISLKETLIETDWNIAFAEKIIERDFPDIGNQAGIREFLGQLRGKIEAIQRGQ